MNSATKCTRGINCYNRLTSKVRKNTQWKYSEVWKIWFLYLKMWRAPMQIHKFKFLRVRRSSNDVICSKVATNLFSTINFKPRKVINDVDYKFNYLVPKYDLVGKKAKELLFYFSCSFKITYFTHSLHSDAQECHHLFFYLENYSLLLILI